MINNTKKTKNDPTSFWLWVVICAVIAVLIYLIVYLLFIKSWTPVSTSTPVTNLISPTLIPAPILISRIDPTKGTPFFTNANGMSLYTFDKDAIGVSTCEGTCATNWPPFIVIGTPQSTLPDELSIIKRNDGSSQYALRGSPLYFYINDKVPGDVTGDGFNNVWHLALPQ